MDLMATGTSVQWIPGGGQDRDRALPFYSRYHTDGTAGVDVLGQDAISHLLRLIGTILPVVQSLLSSLCAGKLTPTSEGFNDWGGRGYDDFVPGGVIKTAPPGDETT